MEIYLNILLAKQFNSRPHDSVFRDDFEVSRGDEEEEDEDEVAMDISETKRCYVYGQCQVCSLHKMILG